MGGLFVNPNVAVSLMAPMVKNIVTGRLVAAAALAMTKA